MSGSGSVCEEGLGCRRELSGPLLRPPLVRLEGCGVDFSSMGSDGGPEEDITAAALPFALLERVLGWGGGSCRSILERLLRAERAGGASVMSGCSGLWSSRAADFLLRAVGGGGRAG